MKKWRPPENNFTVYPNELVEALSTTNFSAYESRIVNFIIRKTLGWQKLTDGIGMGLIEKEIGINRSDASRVLKRLRARKIITNKKNRKGAGYTYNTLGINLNVHQWIRDSKGVGNSTNTPKDSKVYANHPVGVSKSTPKSVGDSANYKRNKETNKRKRNAGDGDGSDSALLGSNQNHTPLTEEQVLNNAKYIEKKRNRPGTAKAVQEAFKLGASPEQVQRRLSNENVHGGDLVQVIKQITVSEGGDT